MVSCGRRFPAYDPVSRLTFAFTVSTFYFSCVIVGKSSCFSVVMRPMLVVTESSTLAYGFGIIFHGFFVSGTTVSFPTSYPAHNTFRHAATYLTMWWRPGKSKRLECTTFRFPRICSALMHFFLFLKPASTILKMSCWNVALSMKFLLSVFSQPRLVARAREIPISSAFLGLL